MAKPPQFKPVETAAGWMVSVPASMSVSGARARKFFPTKPKADKFAVSLRVSYNSGLRGSMISATLALQAQEAERILAGTGITVAEAARLAVARLGGAKSLEPFRARYDQALLANEGVWSARYQSQMDAMLRWLPKDFPDRPCGTLDREAVESALLEVRPTLARSSLDMKSTRVLAVINFRPRHKKSAKIDILSPAQCGALLRACSRIEERRVVALLLFAGIRPDSEAGEIGRLEWDAVGATEIYVSGGVSKTNGDRHIPISTRLRRFLREHPVSGPVIPSGWRRAWQRIRRVAGISSMHDVCRHTFASNCLAAYGEEATKQAMGHTAGSATLFRHYRRAITREAGLKYFR